MNQMQMLIRENFKGKKKSNYSFLYGLNMEFYQNQSPKAAENKVGSNDRQMRGK